MNILLLLFIIYTAFSIVATAFYLWHCAFSKNDFFVLNMSIVEQREFLIGFIVAFVGVLFNLLCYSSILF